MGFHLFENPRLGFIIAVAIELILLLWWLIAPHRVNKLSFLAGPLFAGLFILMDLAVVTYREQLEIHTRRVILAAQEEDAQTIIDLLSEDLQMAGGIDKPHFSSVIKAYMSKPFIRKNSVRNLKILDADEKGGRVEVKIITNTDPKGSYAIYPLVTTQWRFDYKRNKEGQYKIVDLILLKLNNSKPPSGFLRRKY